MNKKNSTAFVVVSGCIQDGRTQHVAGELYTPATNGYAAELLQAGIIRPAAGHLPKGVAALIDSDEGDSDDAGPADDAAQAAPAPALALAATGDLTHEPGAE